MGKTKIQPRQIESLLQEGVTLQQNGALAEAEDTYREILAVRPKHLNATQLLGALMLQTGRLREGIALLQAAIAIDGTQAPIHSNLAYALNAVQRYDEGLASAKRAIRLAPNFADAFNNQGNSLAGLGLAGQALKSFQKALALKPDFAQAWNNRGCALRDLGRPEEALESFDQAIGLQKAYAEAWSNRANALSDLNRPDEAERDYRHALEISPGFADAWNNLGLTLIDLGRHEEALESHERALALDPDAVEAHWNKSLCLLRMGRLVEGFNEYEWRWKRRRIKAGHRVFGEPLWLGDAPLAGKTLLLHAEQGLGDTLQFCRYAQEAAQLGATVILEVPVELTRLLKDLKGVAHVVEQGQPLPPFDLHCPLLSAPLAFRTDLGSIPGAAPYLRADAELTKRWAERLARHAPDAPHALKVGIVWAGGDRSHVPELRKTDARRSISLAMLAPLLDVRDVRFFSLQKGPAAAQVAQPGHTHGAAPRIADFTDELVDFADTAALVTNLDLVISVDTSTAHLAGALGVPVWILNRFDSCWRWMLEREDSPWYPQARLFRQQTLGDWGGVVGAVRMALQALSDGVAARRSRQPAHDTF
ncbi:tetratricopeptide repeat-containing glycosyltransferase family protein [Paraburkholderia sp. BL10I2N1]|uniref:tetratricopeptide repeat-containing glycosyltransferase family protein n=1 Tax=Paraburkholderia sp. BL10I2N1 TaxID=1938796 RepID=UPI001060AADB|nr:tetratricopeptide repeat-containing glycosyltransferase family protein [Paraburkholderia sp. BL10I2N1]TDN61535.1 tetratricopeptide (TPR) repeat protein [Paraburkholderia sp. BL10I2N1]